MSEERLVPKLRFSGFNDEWSINKLDEISSLTSSKRIYSSDYVETGIPFYRGAEITQLKNNEEIKEKLFISTEKYNELKNKFGAPKKDDILVTGVGTLGNVYKIRDNAEFYFKDGNLIWIKDITINPDFLELYLETFKNEMLKLAIGSTQKALTIVSLEKLKVKYPNIQEQRKIANFFEVLDNKIRLLSEKYNYYIDFKKYLMQQIFAQKLRFNFIDDWDVVKLETLIEKGKAGGTPPSTNPDYYNGEIPFLSIKDMTEQGKYIVKTEKSITEEGLNNSSAWIIPKYSLLYSIYASIGLVSINLTEVSTSQAIYGIILKEGVSLEYMYYYLTYFKKNIHRYVETGTQGNLNAKLLKSFEIALPSVDEQEMIVNILSLVDKKIENMEKEVGKMNEFKKGLLQQMFI